MAVKRVSESNRYNRNIMFDRNNVAYTNEEEGSIRIDCGVYSVWIYIDEFGNETLANIKTRSTSSIIPDIRVNSRGNITGISVYGETYPLNDIPELIDNIKDAEQLVNELNVYFGV